MIRYPVAASAAVLDGQGTSAPVVRGATEAHCRAYRGPVRVASDRQQRSRYQSGSSSSATSAWLPTGKRVQEQSPRWSEPLDRAPRGSPDKRSCPLTGHRRWPRASVQRGSLQSTRRCVLGQDCLVYLSWQSSLSRGVTLLAASRAPHQESARGLLSHRDREVRWGAHCYRIAVAVDVDVDVDHRSLVRCPYPRAHSIPC